MSEVQAELPRYQCHKKVWALKIADLVWCYGATPDDKRGAVIVPFEKGHHPFTVCQEWLEQHKPEAGGYYVVYEDGYRSYSPAKAFEEGYARI